MPDESQKDEVEALQRKIARLREELSAAERYFAALTGSEYKSRFELRYTHIHKLNEAMEAALRHLGRAADPIELLRELESGTWGFEPDDKDKHRLAHMGRAYKQGGKNTIELVEGKYQLKVSTSTPK